MARLVPPWLIAAVLWVVGLPGLAVLVAVVGTVVGVAGVVWPAFARVADRVLLGVGHFVGRVLTFVLLGLFEVFVVAPVSLVAWVFRRDPLASYPRPEPGGLWRRRVAEEQGFSDRPFGHETLPERGPVARVLVLVPRVLGWVAIAVALDLLVGSVTRGPQTVITDTDRLTAATADAPWFDAYRAELESVTYEPTPFVLSEPVDRSGEFINVVEGHRRTVVPAGVPAEAPVVWVFGGSPAWGEGQRDDHTIASELARLAAEGGTPVQVVNWAQRGDTAFVAAQRFERAAAHNPAPALALFLDGPDDLNVQAESLTGNPSHYGLEETEQAVEADNRTWWQHYEDTSALFAVGQRIRSVFAVTPAWAQDGTTSQVRSAEVATAAADVYDRGRVMADIVATNASVPARFFWLPVAASDDPDSTYRDAAGRLGPEVTVLDALDDSDGPVFLDGVHTNEAGARQVAEALYEQLRSVLADEQNGQG